MSHVNNRLLMLLLICKFCLPAVIYQPPKIVYPDISQDYYYRQYERVQINCISTGLPKATYKWIKNGTNMDTGLGVSYDSATGTMRILNFTEAYESNYRCIATNSYNISESQHIELSCMSSIIRIRLTRLENFGSIMNNITIRTLAYQYLMLPCNDSKKSVVDKLNYNWYDSYSQRVLNMDENRLYVDNNGSLHFIYVLVKDRDVYGYTCGIHAREGAERKTQFGARIILKVIPILERNEKAYAPVLRYANHPLKAPRFSKAVLECVFSGVDPEDLNLPTQLWMDSFGKIISNSEKYFVSDDGRRLSILNVQQEDENFYTCYAYNKQGKATLNVFLDVLAVPLFSDGPLKDMTQDVGTDAHFKCDARSAPNDMPPSPPIWYSNTNRLVSMGGEAAKFHLDNSAKVLTIKKLKYPEDIMCIQCEVSNEIASIMSTACLNLSRPRKTSSNWLGWIITIFIAIICLSLINVYVAYQLIYMHKLRLGCMGASRNLEQGNGDRHSSITETTNTATTLTEDKTAPVETIVTQTDEPSLSSGDTSMA